MFTMRKQNLILTLLMLLVSQASFAHDWSDSLGPLASASDYYQVTCSTNGYGATEWLEVTLRTETGIPLTSLQVSTEDALNNPLNIYNTTDPINGDQGASATIQAANSTGNPNNANGNYYVSVNKDQIGIVSYIFTFHCMSPSGHTGTSLSQLQNQ